MYYDWSYLHAIDHAFEKVNNDTEEQFDKIYGVFIRDKSPSPCDHELQDEYLVAMKNDFFQFVQKTLLLRRSKMAGDLAIKD